MRSCALSLYWVYQGTGKSSIACNNPTSSQRKRLCFYISPISPNNPRATYATTAASVASLTADSISPATSSSSYSPDLSFPTKNDPSPFEIFHFDPKQNLTEDRVKRRYYDLVRLYHPDSRRSAASRGMDTSRKSAIVKGKEKASGSITSSDSSFPSESEVDAQFKSIVSAYELLRDPARRKLFLQTGYGWEGSGSTPSPWSSASTTSWRTGGVRDANGDIWTPYGPYTFTRGRPMGWSSQYNSRGSHAWDWPAGDPFHPSYKNGGYGRQGDWSVGNINKRGAYRDGTLTSNGAIIMVLITITAFVYPVTYWTALPPTPMKGNLENDWPGGSNVRNSFANAAQATARERERWSNAFSGGRKHEEAAKSLEVARREARLTGNTMKEARKRRVRQIERERAILRAKEVERVEKEGSTGHIHPTVGALPPPSSSST